MGSTSRYVINLKQACDFGEAEVGGKAKNLSRLHEAGLKIPGGFCLSVLAYDSFLKSNGLIDVIVSELGRKPLSSMRWEELWDAALRIRSVFSQGSFPPGLEDELCAAVEDLGAEEELAVRSSAPGEDGAKTSFAGLHESYVGISGAEEVCEKVRLVWASLWSDAALLYRRELGLDPRRSRMAVVVQELVRRNRSGVAFGRDPRSLSEDRAIIEAVQGLCSNLVDGIVDPQRWILDRVSGKVLSSPGDNPLLEATDLDRLLKLLLRLETLFGWAPDVEWTGRREELTLLQARPITGSAPDSDDERQWYLTLSPSTHLLNELCEEVVNRLIPELQEEGERLAGEQLSALDTLELVDRIEERSDLLTKWQRIYQDKFIPFAHGVRQFGRYYNDVMKPIDPYEFVELLETERMLAWSRNEALEALAQKLKGNLPLLKAVQGVLSSSTRRGSSGGHQANLDSLRELPGGLDFQEEFEAFNSKHGDIAHKKTYLKQRSDLFLKNILALAQSPPASVERIKERLRRQNRAEVLERNLLEALQIGERQKALDFLRIARQSWRLRDDDNILIGRLEGQFLRALELGRKRLEESQSGGAQTASIERLAEVLESLKDKLLRLSPKSNTQVRKSAAGETPRQLVGQPAAPGLGKGPARCIRSLENLGDFQAGEVLVCDAIQPTMTHVVPLAAGIVERRGGMLIHGAIIARELGIPCVNGIRDGLEVLGDGELLTVDGYLGIVSVGKATLDLEVDS